MFKNCLMQTSALCVMAFMILGQTVCAQEPDTLGTKTIRDNTSLTDRQLWHGILRAGYSIASENSFHPVDKGSFAVSGGLYVRPWRSLYAG